MSEAKFEPIPTRWGEIGLGARGAAQQHSRRIQSCPAHANRVFEFQDFQTSSIESSSTRVQNFVVVAHLLDEL